MGDGRETAAAAAGHVMREVRVEGGMGHVARSALQRRAVAGVTWGGCAASGGGGGAAAVTWCGAAGGPSPPPLPLPCERGGRAKMAAVS